MEGSHVSGGPLKRGHVIAALLAVYVIWGSTYLAIAFAVQTIPPFIQAGLRFALAGSLVYFFMRWRGAPKPPRETWKPAIIVGGLLLLGGNGLVSFAEQEVPSGITALIIGIVPLFVALIAWFGPTRRRPPTLALAGIALGFMGVALLVDPFGSGQPVASAPMVALLVLACFLWSFGTVYGQTAKLANPPFLAFGMEMIGGSACLFGAAAVTGEFTRFDVAGVSDLSAWAFVYLVTIGALGGFTAYLWLIRNVPAHVATTYAFVNPVIAIALGSLLAAEPLTVTTVVAAAIIVVAVAIITQARPPAPAQPPPVQPPAKG